VSVSKYTLIYLLHEAESFLRS